MGVIVNFFEEAKTRGKKNMPSPKRAERKWPTSKSLKDTVTKNVRMVWEHKKWKQTTFGGKGRNYERVSKGQTSATVTTLEAIAAKGQFPAWYLTVPNMDIKAIESPELAILVATYLSASQEHREKIVDAAKIVSVLD